jgi:hypothetical protein
MIDLNQLIGMNLDEGEILAAKLGCSLRVVSINGKYFAINLDACSGRLDIKIENNIITCLHYFGSMTKLYSKNYEITYNFIENLTNQKYNFTFLHSRQQIENKEFVDLFILNNGKQIPICTLDKEGNVLDDFMDIKRQLNLKEFS